MTAERLSPQPEPLFQPVAISTLAVGGVFTKSRTARPPGGREEQAVARFSVETPLLEIDGGGRGNAIS